MENNNIISKRIKLKSFNDNESSLNKLTEQGKN